MRQRLSKLREKNPQWKGGKRILGTGYFGVLTPEHPNARKDGYYMEHRLIMEKHIGRLLRKGEVVHHKDGNIKNNSIENLELYGSHSEHAKHHYPKGRPVA